MPIKSLNFCASVPVIFEPFKIFTRHILEYLEEIVYIRMFKAPPLVVRMHSFPENFWSEILFQSTKEEYPFVIIDDGVIARRKIS